MRRAEKLTPHGLNHTKWKIKKSRLIVRKRLARRWDMPGLMHSLDLCINSYMCSACYISRKKRLMDKKLVDEKYHMLLPVERHGAFLISAPRNISSVSCMLDQSGRNLTSREAGRGMRFINHRWNDPQLQGTYIIILCNAHRAKNWLFLGSLWDERD